MALVQNISSLKRVFVFASGHKNSLQTRATLFNAFLASLSVFGHFYASISILVSTNETTLAKRTVLSAPMRYGVCLVASYPVLRTVRLRTTSLRKV